LLLQLEKNFILAGHLGKTNKSWKNLCGPQIEKAQKAYAILADCERNMKINRINNQLIGKSTLYGCKNWLISTYLILE